MASNETEARRSQQQLRISEERYRLIVENARHVAIFTIDPELKVTDWHQGAESAFGFSREEILGQDSRILWTEEDQREGAPEQEAETAAREGRANDVRWHVRKGGVPVFIEGVSTALRDTDGELLGFLKIGLDATERRRAEEYERTLFHELQHRVRNILALIRSVARRTADTTESREEYLQHFDGRLSAMARLQAMLTRRPDTMVNLRDLLLEEIEAQSLMEDRFDLSGPEVELPSKAAEILSLAIHELSTNSIKYGVLADGAEGIKVDWRLMRRDKTQWLELHWAEP